MLKWRKCLLGYTFRIYQAPQMTTIFMMGRLKAFYALCDWKWRHQPWQPLLLPFTIPACPGSTQAKRRNSISKWILWISLEEKMLISDFKVFKIQARNTLNINDSKLIDKLQTYKISYFVCHSAESTFQQKLVEVNTLTEDYFREIR